MKNNYLIPAVDPVGVIESLPRRPDQSPLMRQYKSGYENYLGMLPVLREDDPLLQAKVNVSGVVVSALAKDLKKTAPWIHDLPEANKFKRVIVAVEEPAIEPLDEAIGTLIMADAANEPSPLSREVRLGLLQHPGTVIKEGAELLVAQWGPGFSSPVHGHAPGLLHEEILVGEIMSNTYRWVRDGVVRPVRSDVVGPGLLVSSYAPPTAKGVRMGLIHNFTAIKPTSSLHYVPEHTRDGRDNRFEVERFEMSGWGVKQITGDEGARLQIGDVAMVRSVGVPEHGDHYIIITGPLVMKPHGRRPEDVAIMAPETKELLDTYTPTNGDGLVLLKLTEVARREFLEFHGITVNGKVNFPAI